MLVCFTSVNTRSPPTCDYGNLRTATHNVRATAAAILKHYTTDFPARNAVSAFRGFNISPAEVDSQYLVYLALLVRLNLSARRADGAYPARTCSIRTTLLRDRPPVPALNPIYVGRFVLSYLKMVTAMLTSL